MSTHLADPSCRHSRHGRAVDRVIIHVTEGSYAGALAWLTSPAGGARGNAPTCAHYLISQKGEIAQLCPDDESCYHAGSHTEAGWNERSIGIEHEGYTGITTPSDAQLAASARVVAILLRKFGLPADRQHVIGHSEVPGATHTDPGHLWPWDTFMQLVQAS